MQTQTLNGIVLWIKVYAYAKVIFSSSQSVRLLINDVYYLDITYNRQRHTGTDGHTNTLMLFLCFVKLVFFYR